MITIRDGLRITGVTIERAHTRDRQQRSAKLAGSRVDLHLHDLTVEEAAELSRTCAGKHGVELTLRISEPVDHVLERAMALSVDAAGAAELLRVARNMALAKLEGR